MDSSSSYSSEDGRSPPCSPGGKRYSGTTPLALHRKQFKGSSPNSRRSTCKSSDYRGVSKCAKDGRWQSRIRVGKSVKYLGRYRTEHAAAVKYDEAALALHGRRAVLNFELSDAELERAVASAAVKRVEFGFDGGSDGMHDAYLARPSASRGSSRSASPATEAHVEDDEDEDERTDGGMMRPEDQDLVSDEQCAAASLMWLKLSLKAA